MSCLDDYPKHSSIGKHKETLAARFGGAENIAFLNGSVWKKHRMVSQIEPEADQDSSNHVYILRSQIQPSIDQCL